MTDGNNQRDSNSILTRLNQILDHGEVTIKYDDISIFIQYFQTSSFAKTNTEYKRSITYDELVSLDSDINLLKNQHSTNKLCDYFQDCFKEAKDFQKKIQDLLKYGKQFIFKDKFTNIKKKKFNYFRSKMDTIILQYGNFYDRNQPKDSKNDAKNIPFLTVENLLYFGALLQRKKEKTLKHIFEKMFQFDNKTIEEAIKQLNIDDPIQCSIQMFSHFFNNPTNIRQQEENVDETFKDFKLSLQRYFLSHNFLIVKVDIPSETFHAYHIIPRLLYFINWSPVFYETVFCSEDTNINKYFEDLEKIQFLNRPEYCFIVHPEFLSIENKNALREIILSRLKPIPDITMQKIVIITSSSEFKFGNLPDDLNGRIFTQGEVSMNVNTDIIRDSNITRNHQSYFSIQIVQSEKPGSGKSTFIKQKIEKIKQEHPLIKFNVSHNFISDGNQEIPVKSFKNTEKNSFNIIHIKFDDKIMEKGITFWSKMYQLYTNGFTFLKNGEPFIIEEGKNLVIFEIPQLRKGVPLQSLNEFPIPISSKGESNEDSKNQRENFSLKSLIPKSFEIKDTFFENDYVYSGNYYSFGISQIVKNLKKKPLKKIDNLKVYIDLMYIRIFEEKMPEISFRKYGYMEKYLSKYIKFYLNSLSGELDHNQFIIFFYLLTVSLYYYYDCLPKNDNEISQKYTNKIGLTFFTINDLFNDYIRQRRFHFYSTKSSEELFRPLKNYNLKKCNFEICFNYNQKEDLKKPLFDIFGSSEQYHEVIKNFVKKNPQSYIAHAEITIPTLFRSSVIINRIFLSQPIILSGETGCGKTFSLMLLFELFKLPINKAKNSLNIVICQTLNCHGGITKKDIINHIKKSTKSSKKHVIFFDELNTSPDSSYIEQYFLNENVVNNTKYAFIGALNPCKKKNSISSILTNVGLPQIIKEEKTVYSVNEKEKVLSENISDMMYHVHHPQEATKDIIFNFNPICYEGEDEFYPNEEKRAIHLIIEDAFNRIIEENERTEILEKLQGYIDICIPFIRRLMNERAVISYRDVKRTMIIFNELYKYIKSHEENSEIKIDDLPLIVTIISFVLRLPNKQDISESTLKSYGINDKSSFIQILKKCSSKDKKYSIFGTNKNIIYIRKKMLSLLGDREEIKKKFMTFVYQYTFEYLKDDSIWKFQSTFIHLFIMDVCIRCKLPCFVIGMPGTSKSYAIELLKKHYKKKLYVSTYMSSRTSSPDGIKSQYYDASFKQIMNNNEDDCYCVVFIDEMGNANINPSRPLKFLHGILDHGLALNETGYSNKVATIGVSNYTMDFANMNRGVLVYTDLPDLDEILTVFALDENKKSDEITDVQSYINERDTIDKKHVTKIFKYLWPQNMPETIALRSIYNLRYLIDKNNGFDNNDVCRILRELFNSKRLENTNNYNNLIKEIPTNIKNFEIDNLCCFLERIACKDTKSNKSLSVFTKNFEAIEYFQLFTDGEFITFLNNQYTQKNIQIAFEKTKFDEFNYILFAEDFKKTPEQISQVALSKIIECISSTNKNILFVGNHPCFDSCLDLLNVPHTEEKLKREVTLGSGFSMKFELTNTDFYIIMIDNIDDIQNKSTSKNPFSSAFLDRTEVVYLDWKIIGPYYLQYKCQLSPSAAQEQCKQISEILEKHIKYETEEPEYFHLSIKSLYQNIKNIDIGNENLNKLLKYRWKNGIKSVILTKSKISEDVYHNFDIGIEDIIIKNDINIEDFSSLRQSIDLHENTKKLIIIKCSYFDKLHFAHLKSFFDQISNPQNHYNIFIIYYGCDPKDFEGLSTFRWPIFSMDDVSFHPELEQKDQLTIAETKDMIKKFNHMNEYKQHKDTMKCNILIRNIFNQIIKFIERKIEFDSNQKINIYNQYSKSIFIQESSFFNEIKEKFDINNETKYFNIPDKTNLNTSIKSQIISIIYQRLCDKMMTFFIFRFGHNENEAGDTNKTDFFLKCKYLDLPLNSYLNRSNSNPNYCLFSDYIQFLATNSVRFDDQMLKRKCIADRSLLAIGMAKEAKKKFLNIYKNVCNHKISIAEFDEFDNNVVYLQTYVDFNHFRSFAALNLHNLNDTSFWDRYIEDSLQVNNSNSRGTPIITCSKILDSIKEFRNKSIFEIFKSPISLKSNTDKCKIFEQLTSQCEFKINPNDIVYQIFNEFNESIKFKNDGALKSIKKIKELLSKKKIDQEIINQNKDIISSIEVFHALSQWNADDIKKSLLPKYEMINKENNDIFNPIIIEDPKHCMKYTFIGGNNYNDNSDKAIHFKKECLIDKIQSMNNKGSTEKSIRDFRNLLFSGFQDDIPLAIKANDQYTKSITEENRIKLAKILDPFYGDIRIIKFIVKNEDNNKFEFDKSAFSESELTFRHVFKFFVTESKTLKIYYCEMAKPSIAQIIWFHVAFNVPSDYPLTTLTIKETPFFIDFKTVPKIVNTIIHLRHIFSFNPVFIPIILHCTTLFKNCRCKLLLYSLSYFNDDNFKNIQKDVDILEKFIEHNYENQYKIIRNQSAYYQIEFILNIFYKKYDEIVEQINQILCKNKITNNLMNYEQCEVFPHMLITNFSLNNVLLPFLYSTNITSFDEIENYLKGLFSMKDNSILNIFNLEYNNSYYPLFTVSYGKKDKDFIGFTSEDYKCLFKNYIDFNINDIKLTKIKGKNASLRFNASLLSFFHFIYLNKTIEIKKYDELDNINDLSDCHLDAYTNIIDYSFSIKIKGFSFTQSQNNFDALYFEENKMYPLQSIFELIPPELKEGILEYQRSQKGLKIIKTKEENEEEFVEEEEFLEEEEEEEEFEEEEEEFEEEEEELD